MIVQATKRFTSRNGARTILVRTVDPDVMVFIVGVFFKLILF